MLLYVVEFGVVNALLLGCVSVSAGFWWGMAWTVRMPSRIPRLPPTVAVHGHRLHLALVPGRPARKEWTVTEQLGSVVVGYARLVFHRGEFSTDASTGPVVDADWVAVLDKAFRRTWPRSATAGVLERAAVGRAF